VLETLLVLLPPVEAVLPAAPLEWQTMHGVMVVFTFLCSETPLGAEPIEQEPQLSEVRFIEIVAMLFEVLGVPVLLLVDALEWQTMHGVMVAFTFLCAETPLGADPIEQEPQPSEVRFIDTLAVVVGGGV